ncbi:Autophagy protein 22 [Sorochytrium milnesiophthora]
MSPARTSTSQDPMIESPLPPPSAPPKTTVREIRGWYAYNWASEVISAAGLTVFLPLVLEDLTRQVGVEAGTGLPCASATDSSGDNCMVRFGATTTNTVSYTLYITAISVALQALTFISLGSLADYGRWRKLFMRAFATVGAVCFILFVVVKPATYELAAVLTVLGNICYGAANVFYNAYLPLLVENHPEVTACRQEIFGNNRVLAEDGEKMTKYLKVSSDIGNTISSKGFACGYAAGVLLLIIGAGLVLAMGQTTLSMQVVLCLAGVWWLVWSFWTWHTLLERPGPPLPVGENWVTLSWKRVIRTVRQWRRIPNLFLYLCAFFLFSDGSNTITQVAILYGKTSLKLGNTELIIIAIVIPFSCGVGNMIWLRLAQRFHWTTHKTLLILLSLLFVIPLYGTLSLWLPLLRTKIEVYILAIWFGLVLGSWQSYSRVMMSDMGRIPRGFESEFFSLYEITNKGSSWLGPLATGAITDATRDIRYSWIFLVFMLGVPLPLVYMVNVVKGKEEARLYAAQEAGEDVPMAPLDAPSSKKSDTEKQA